MLLWYYGSISARLHRLFLKFTRLYASVKLLDAKFTLHPRLAWKDIHEMYAPAIRY